jgi:hypothetical protein
MAEYENLTDNVVNLRMNREGVNSGELHAALIWNDIADLDLHVITPSKEHLYFAHKESRCGGWLDVDMNAGNWTLEPIENIFWASAPSGTYEIYVHNFNNRTDDNTVFTDRHRKVPFRVKLTRNGESQWFQGKVGPKEKLTCFKFNHTGKGAVGSFVVLPESNEKLTFEQHCARNGVTYNKGQGYYAVIRKEKVSTKKGVLLYDKANDVFVIGRNEVFEKLGLDPEQDHQIAPSMIPTNHILFVQSTSHNRGIPPGIKVLMKVPMREALQFRRHESYRNLI